MATGAGKKARGGINDEKGARNVKDLAEKGIVVAESSPFGLWVPVWPPLRVHHWVLSEQHFGR